MFVDFFIHRPVFATVCALLIILAGVVVIPSLPISLYPQLAPPQVTVAATYVGASAQEVESAVTIPLEEAIQWCRRHGLYDVQQRQQWHLDHHDHVQDGL